jgi:hypothetical protein
MASIKILANNRMQKQNINNLHNAKLKNLLSEESNDYLLALSSIHEQIIGCQPNAIKNILIIFKRQE